MCGIIQREYDHFRKSCGDLVRPVQLCTQAEGYTIYKTWYWDPHCDSLGSGLALSFFDAAVNQGSMEAIRILQVALGVPSDGQWGPFTAAAAGRTPVAAAVTRFAARRRVVYQGIAQQHPSQERFLADWLGRAEKIMNASLVMAGARQ
jgi:lysozyme family protein